MLDALRRLECDYAQGYLIGKPQTLAELLARH
jgi:EAL domain-containing protein (putative c-di-GMP-specific phosphodiesterase class I)